ncbi:pirin family protein [Actinophytocola glycyrrhizae]|uniref:Pirin family protein n=1 Tax=Actinophytocola glycyrrhizae TaxID=2044873 RepID=A0ABV9S8J7_9PSEU
MSNLETSPDVTACHTAADDHAVAELFEPRAVPLGGLRAMQVDRVMPQRGLPTVGAWCFLDSFGPHHEQMRVLPHPHTGLQTVTWPLSGEIHHRDSLGSDVLVRPGQLNLMTAGSGVAHSEISTSAGPLSGLQLWVALPASHASTPPAFEQHVDLPVHHAPGVTATVLMGTLGDLTSPATAHTPIVGADLTLTGPAELPLRPDHEHAVLAVDPVTVAGTEVARGHLLYLGTGRSGLRLDGTGRALLLGGEPFPDELVMWWNFVGRSHEEIATARADWEAAAPRFGEVVGHDGARIPAPELPGVRLAPRKRRRPL